MDNSELVPLRRRRSALYLILYKVIYHHITVRRYYTVIPSAVGITVHVIPVCVCASSARDTRVHVCARVPRTHSVHVDTRGGTAERRALQYLISFLI